MLSRASLSQGPHRPAYEGRLARTSRSVLRGDELPARAAQCTSGISLASFA